MVIPPEIYFGLTTAVLAVVFAIVWLAWRSKRSKGAGEQIEPFIAEAKYDDLEPDSADTSEQHDQLQEAGHHSIRRADLNGSDSKIEAQFGFYSSEQEYKGFKIYLSEKQPGIWIAIVKRPSDRKKTGRVKNAETWTSREFYQMQAALTEAKAVVDHRVLL